MGISLLEPVAAGNAVRVYLDPPPGARYWTVLRRTADVFTGQDDQGAVVVASQSTDNVVLDLKALVNGTTYYYRFYGWDGARWTAAPSLAVVPASRYLGDTADPVGTLADRLEAGLAVEVERGVLKPKSGQVPVFQAPSILADQVTFPCVTVHLDSLAPAERFLGEEVGAPEHATNGAWTEYEGWLARSQITVTGVARSVDERSALRRAIMRVVQANLGVFASLGINQVEFSLSDSEQLQENAAPLFLSGGTFSCIAHSFVSDDTPEITDVVSTPEPWSP